jgi:TPP-dependent pyruvate/acetoin dehydrogenase alpha subunit
MSPPSRKETLRGNATRVNISPMIQTASKPQVGDDISSVRENYLRAFRIMLLARAADDKFASLYRAGKIHGGVFLGRGQEALSVSIGLALRKGDVLRP